MAKVSSAVVSQLKSQIDEYVKQAEENVPGVVYVAVNKKGEPVFEHAAGSLGLGVNKPMTLDSVFWIASCTKMITGVACMQLVEQGKLSLDDHESVYKIAPELEKVQVLDPSDFTKTVPKEKEITLRMLLAHTAGFAYSFFDPRLNAYYGPTGVNEFSGLAADIMLQPLVNQPGSAWEYGINIDWAGLLVERVSGMKLDDYFHKNILGPMGLEHIKMFPTSEMKHNLAYMHARNPQTGKLELHSDGHLNRAALIAHSDAEKAAVFNYGGAGCFAQPKEYAQIISMLLNNGTHAPTGAQILKAETVDAMFTNQIPEFPNFGRNPIPAPKPTLSNPLPELYPEPHDIPQGWGLTFFLHLKQSGIHSEGTAWWAGLSNLFWWADRQKGLGGMIATQILPFGDAKVLGLWAQVEMGLYQNLE